MSTELSGKPDAWKLTRPVWGWGRGETPRPTPHTTQEAVIFVPGESKPLPEFIRDCA